LDHASFAKGGQAILRRKERHGIVRIEGKAEIEEGQGGEQK